MWARSPSGHAQRSASQKKITRFQRPEGAKLGGTTHKMTWEYLRIPTILVGISDMAEISGRHMVWLQDLFWLDLQFFRTLDDCCTLLNQLPFLLKVYRKPWEFNISHRLSKQVLSGKIDLEVDSVPGRKSNVQAAEVSNFKITKKEYHMIPHCSSPLLYHIYLPSLGLHPSLRTVSRLVRRQDWQRVYDVERGGLHMAKGIDHVTGWVWRFPKMGDPPKNRFQH